MHCKKCRRWVSVLLIDFSHGECAYCTTRSSSISDEKTKELIKMGECLFPVNQSGGKSDE